MEVVVAVSAQRDVIDDAGRAFVLGGTIGTTSLAGQRCHRGGDATPMAAPMPERQPSPLETAKRHVEQAFVPRIATSCCCPSAQQC
ncbi:hypothetical protein F4560_003354 [Saccharothrix ecbatanensis]|uniref:Uncharacterized protein n=1 Tax=Saccharothrix ecbatanensis TaxID=1105145 RepID=A0A7W9HKE5_9PSEU|nr:hypothetical protein [Saccharothrix ecbatanensis]